MTKNKLHERIASLFELQQLGKELSLDQEFLIASVLENQHKKFKEISEKAYASGEGFAFKMLTYVWDYMRNSFGKGYETAFSIRVDDQFTFRFMEKAYNFAKENRALGLGALGWHSLLQSKMLAFDSQEAYNLNTEIFKFIKEKSYKASEEMAKMYGEPAVLKGYGRRNTTLNAVAPTTSSAFILGQVSQGIEPIWSNIYVKDIAKIKTTIRNPVLEKLLEAKGQSTSDVWKSIRDHKNKHHSKKVRKKS